jgi:hypothetical protein
MSNQLVEFKEEFINSLSVAYPEKAVFLMGMQFEIMYLVEYVKENNSTPESFNPLEFKKYLDNKPPFYTYYNVSSMTPSNACAGSLFFDNTTKTMKLYDGYQWITLS